MNTILYITYVDLNARLSGSSVRPYKMLCAFQELGYEVKLLCGGQGHSDRRVRLQNAKEIEKWLKNHQPDFCYIESPTYPILLHEDRKLFKILKRKHIPTGYFYRDFYRYFPDLFPRRKGVVNGLKELYLDYLQWRTDSAVANVDIVYVPSEEARKVLNKYSKVLPLPPAGNELKEVTTHYSKTCIYVGGITEHYGGEMLLSAFELLNSQGEQYRLILVCRKEEWESFSHPSKGAKWLDVHHVSGEGLEPLYAAAAAAAMIPKANNEYNNLAISVKMFEYMEHGLPIVAVKSDAMDRYFEKYNLGITTEYDAKKFAMAIEELLCDETSYADRCKSVKDALLRENQWIHRAEQVRDELLSGEMRE